MKIGIIGYERPDMESLLQAYALSAFLKKYDVESYFVTNEKAKDKEESTAEAKRGLADWLLQRKYISTSNVKAIPVMKGFIQAELGMNKDNKVATDAYVMVNNKASVDMNGKEAAFVDFYQVNFDKKATIVETVLLNRTKVYEDLANKKQPEGKYLFLDCTSEKSPLIGFAQKFAAKNKLKVISLVNARKYWRFESTVEIYDPKEYLAYVKGASMVVTDTFLTTLFGILFHKKFVSADNAMFLGKNRRLLHQLSLTGHFYGNNELSIDESYAVEKWDKIDAKLEQIRLDLTNFAETKLELEIPFKDCQVNCPTNILKSECCGCYACKEVCPVGAITMVQDKEGFYYPQVNDKCIHCNLCNKVCVKNKNSQTVEYKEEYPKAFCAINTDEEIRFLSSSGGVFPSLVKYAIEERQGVVFGVKWDEDMNAVSAMATTMEEAKAFYGSKYVKSEIDSIYKKVKEQLEAGKFVVFSSLPCEAAGLKAFLRKDYDNLFLCEILCHAAPSPTVFKDYIKFIENKFKSKVTHVSFREKTKGWLIHQCNMVFTFKDREPLVVNARRNNYFRNFLKDNIQRPGCAKCSFTARNRVGDITIGDFWGINKLDEEMFDNKGASVVLINTAKGFDVWNVMSRDFNFKEKTIKEAFRFNHSKPMPMKRERNALFSKYGEKEINQLLLEYNDLKK